MFTTPKLTDRQDKAIRTLLESDVVDRVLSAAEQRDLQHRKTLLKELSEIARKLQDHQKAEVSRECTAAVQLVEQREHELIQARQGLVDARARHDAVQHFLQARQFEINAELSTGSEERIDDFRVHCSNLDDSVRHALAIWVAEPQKNWMGRSTEPIYASNELVVKLARNTLKRCMGSCEAMRLQPLGHSEVSERLIEMCQALEPALFQFSLNAPQVAADGTVGRPLPWSGGPRWMVDEILAEERRKLDEIYGPPRQPAAIAPQARRV